MFAYVQRCVSERYTLYVENVSGLFMFFMLVPERSYG